MGRKVWDLLGIGIGPFNLGLAALAEPLDLEAVFFDKRHAFSWHPGMMLRQATLQVPFLADLVTFADPTSPFSFVQWLKVTGRIYPFYIRESFYVLRSEYDAYLRWVAGQLGSLRWGEEVVSVSRSLDSSFYTVRTIDADRNRRAHLARNVVVGIGSRPYTPMALEAAADLVVHTSEYVDNKDRVRAADSIIIVGSGQSGAEVYQDLIADVSDRGGRVDWFTRSPRFFPMEYTKLTLEMTSPEYTDHFHALSEAARKRLGREQRHLYKGISGDLVDEIYDTLYTLSASGPVGSDLMANVEVISSSIHPDGRGVRLHLRHQETGQTFQRDADVVIAATGYKPAQAEFLDGLSHGLQRDESGMLIVTRDYKIHGEGGWVFVQNGEEHTHGLTAPDLGFGAWRNSKILEQIQGVPPYMIEDRIAFQRFGINVAPARDEKGVL